MAKLVEVYRNDKQKLSRRQLPLVIDENLTMVMDMNSMGFLDNPTVRGKELDKFLDMFNTLTPQEVKSAFEVDQKDFLAILSETVPCVGCRRSVERLYDQLKKSGHPALEPLVINRNGSLTIKDDHFGWPHLLCTLLYGHSTRLHQLVESQLRSKKSRRCILHSLDSQRVRTPWKEVWDIMRPQCRDEVLSIDSGVLLVTLEGYLQKHRFCTDCKAKVIRAYWLLVEEPEPSREKGFSPGLYAGIKRCLPDKHIHLPTHNDYVSVLVARVQEDLLEKFAAGGGGERHAKTLESAQGEVLTCLGLCVYERLHRIQMRLKEEETTCQVLAAVAVDALYRKFQISVDSKRGISKLDLLFKELTKEELIKQQKKEQKKLKRKRRRKRRARGDSKENEEEEEEEEIENSGGDFICECSQDCGYSSGNNNASSSPSSPEGSEVACCDGFCNDEGVCNSDLLKIESKGLQQNGKFILSLEQMLEEEANSSNEDDCYIPLEEVKEFQSRVNINQIREELRETLRKRFAELCVTHNVKT